MASGQFIINAPYAPDEEDYDNEIFEFSEKLITESYKKAPDLDIDEIIEETMDCMEEGFLVSFASQSLAAESITFLYFEIEFLFWFYNENTKNIEVLELFVVPNVRSEYSEQY